MCVQMTARYYVDIIQNEYGAAIICEDLYYFMVSFKVDVSG